MLTAGLRAAQTAAMGGYTNELPEWDQSRFQAPEPFRRYDSLVTRFGLTVPLAILAYGSVWLMWVIATAGTPIANGVPTAVVPIALLGLAGWLVRVLPQVPSRAELRAVTVDGGRAFAVGAFPATATYLVARRDGLILLRGVGARPAFIDWSRIDVVGLKVSPFGVGVSFSFDGAWYDVPLVLEVGGPVASAWSSDPIGAKWRVLAAAEGCFRQFVPVHVTGKTGSRG